jgi:hypothetical protein
MGFIPLAYWGSKTCPGYLQTGSLVLYYNTQIMDSYPGVPGAPEPQDGTHIFNLANSASYVGDIAGGISTYNPTLLAVNSSITGVDDVPWNLYDGSPSTILIRGIFSFPTGSSFYYVLQNTNNSNEGLRYYGQSGSFGFQRGVGICPSTMNAGVGMTTATNAFNTLAVVRESSPGAKLYLTTDKSNFAQQFTQSLASCTIINDTNLFSTNGYIQSVAVYSKQLSQIELISASQAMECGALPQGYVSPIVPSGLCGCATVSFWGTGGKGHYGNNFSYIPCGDYIRYTGYVLPAQTTPYTLCVSTGSITVTDGGWNNLGCCTSGSCPSC